MTNLATPAEQSGLANVDVASTVVAKASRTTANLPQVQECFVGSATSGFEDEGGVSAHPMWDLRAGQPTSRRANHNSMNFGSMRTGAAGR